MSNSRYATSIHILTLLTLEKGKWLSSEYLADSININPVLVRKEISILRKAGMVKSKEGKSGGCMLAKPADQIFLSDIYSIVNQKPVLSISRHEPNLKCLVGKQITEHLISLFNEAENAMIERLGNKTLKQFVDMFS